MDYQPDRLRDSLARHIANSPLYDGDPEKIRITQRGHKIKIRYRATRESNRSTQTKFNLRIQNRVVTIDWFERDKAQRNQGFGRQLYNLLEQFFLDEGCAAVELVASNERKSRFWKSLGFSGTNPYVLTKNLT